ncbi:D-2-hydroxyacid dehydrogenase [Bacillus sp. HMF5848]|uniref:D-2-hydroxyacid dehydrogenase n=1 Tax=Bacillus sp. HMF5848 TaxID=2495421 RepID=UPI000F786A18|nr:D-2-hydroxyacid dehydrogenase [Bacillus sp. HMF5848]RSK26164.1 D-2-hydroxyacid dehydrogenase [Bacillus sp. HMF5848]
MNIVTTLKIPELTLLQLRQRFPTVNFIVHNNIENAKNSLHIADVIVTFGEDINTEKLNQAKQLKWIMVMSAGMDKMPFKDIAQRGIVVTNVKGIHKMPMAEYTIGMMLQVAKEFPKLMKNQDNKVWDRTVVRMSELNEATLCVIGIGAIGEEIARLAKAFNMKVIGVNTSGKADSVADTIVAMEDLNVVLPNADYIVSVLPSTPETKYCLNKKHFGVMKQDAVFINIGRGDVVKDSVLIEVLQESLIKHAVLDVFEKEPLSSDHPFWDMENVTITPHTSSITKKYLPRSMEIFEENLDRWLKGESELINKIDLNKGY